MKKIEWAKHLKNKAQDITAIILIAILTWVVFGYQGSLLGFYADDSGFLLDIVLNMPLKDLFASMYAYVPGRNLHILWQYFVTMLAGGTGIENLPAMHAIQTFVDAVNGILLYVFLRLCRVQLWPAFVAAVAFIIFPNHGETHFWLSSLPMNILSTFFVLVLLCLAVLFLYIDKSKNENLIRILLLSLVLTFIASMFTYDQVVPVTMTIMTLLGAALFSRNRRYRSTIICIWLTCVGLFLALLAWKITTPGGGPSFSHLNLEHILLTFLRSCWLWISILLVPYDLIDLLSARSIGDILYTLKHLEVAFPIWVRASSSDRWLTLIITAAVISATLIFYIKRSKAINCNNVFPLNKILILGGAFFFLLAYLPSYLWHLAPRHSYLPSVGVAIVIAGLLNSFQSDDDRITKLKLGILIILPIFFGNFILSNLVEKHFWSSSFKMRSNIYQNLKKNYISNNPTTVLFVGFPYRPYPGSPEQAFLYNEHPGAASIVTKHKIIDQEIALHPIPSKTGYFIKTEENRWGNERLIHIKKQEATVVIFDGIDSITGNIQTTYDHHRNLFSHEKYFSLQSINNVDSAANLLVLAQKTGYDIFIGSFPLGLNEVLALVPSVLKGGKMLPVFYTAPLDSERYMIPADVSGNQSGTPAAFRLTYRLAMPKIDGFQLYIVNGERSRLVAEARLVE